MWFSKLDDAFFSDDAIFLKQNFINKILQSNHLSTYHSVRVGHTKLHPALRGSPVWLMYWSLRF